MESSAVGKTEATFKKKKLIYVKQTSRDTCTIFLPLFLHTKKKDGP
jgi:hypothetical protein